MFWFFFSPGKCLLIILLWLGLPRYFKTCYRKELFRPSISQQRLKTAVQARISRVRPLILQDNILVFCPVAVSARAGISFTSITVSSSCRRERGWQHSAESCRITSSFWGWCGRWEQGGSNAEGTDRVFIWSSKKDGEWVVAKKKKSKGSRSQLREKENKITFY